MLIREREKKSEIKPERLRLGNIPFPTLLLYSKLYRNGSDGFQLLYLFCELDGNFICACWPKLLNTIKPNTSLLKGHFMI